MLVDEVEYSRWIMHAKKTLDSAKGDLERGDYNWSCFKAHQAAEAAIKALLRGLGLPVYGHSIYKFLVQASDKGLEPPKEIIEYAKSLDKLYIPTRYPNAWAEGVPHEYYTKRDAERAIRQAREIIKWVEELWKYLKKGKG